MRTVGLVGGLGPESTIDHYGVVLGGTELPLLLASPTLADLHVLDTTAIHVCAIVDRLTAT